MMTKAMMNLAIETDSKKLNSNIRAALKLIGLKIPSDLVVSRSLGRLEIAVENYSDRCGDMGFRCATDDEIIFSNRLEVHKLGRGDTFTAMIDGEEVRVRPSSLTARIVVRTREEIVTFES